MAKNPSIVWNANTPR